MSLPELAKSETEMLFSENEALVLRSLLRAIPDLVWLKDIDGKYLFCNSRFERFFGEKESKIVGKTDADYVPYSQAQFFLQKDREAIEANKPSVNTEWIKYADDGHREFVETIKSPIYNPDGDLIGILGISRDITSRFFERKDIGKFLIGIENSSEGIFITDINGSIEFVNPAFEKIYGYSRSEALGKTPRILKSGLISQEVYRNKWNTLLAGIPVNHEIINKTKDGRFIYVEASDNPILNEKGDISGFLSINHDITSRKLAEEALIKAKEKAEESNRLKTAFLQNISHEIRTPLNAIAGFSALLSMPDNTQEDQSLYIDTLLKSSDHLLKIVNDIVDLSSIEAKSIEIQITSFDINSRFEILYNQCLNSAKAKNITLSYKTELPSENTEIMTDLLKFDRIMSNLLNNAIKFSQKGEITFGCQLKDSEIEFYVSDTGIGIPPELHKKIFENFYQVEYSINRKYEGTGLGLSISRALVENLGGKIWVNSENGKGSTFYFTLPYVNAEEKIDQVAYIDKQSKSDCACQKTVLVAEDSIDNFNLIKTFLKKTGYAVKHAVNGSDAVEICKSDKTINLVIMDVNMPIMNGYKATRLIREFNKDIIIIAQTAYYDDREAAFDSGCNDFISKPFTIEEFHNIIRKNLNKKQTQQTAKGN